MALKNKKLIKDHEVEPALAEAIQARLKHGMLDCVAAFILAKEQGTAPFALGEAADSLGIHLSHCQLGLFGFPGHAKAWERPGWKKTDVPNGFETAVRSVLDPDGSLSCSAAWGLDDRFGVGRAQVGFFASLLNIKIKRCQLGAF